MGLERMGHKFGAFLCLLAAVEIVYSLDNQILTGSRAWDPQNENDPRYKNWLNMALQKTGRTDVIVVSMDSVVTKQAGDNTILQIRFSGKYNGPATNKLKCFYIFEMTGGGQLLKIDRQNCS